MNPILILEQLAKAPIHSQCIEQCLYVMEDELTTAYLNQDMDAIRHILSQGRVQANEVAVARV